MKKLIVLTVMLCMTLTSTKILANCPDPQGVTNSVYCTMAPPYSWAHGLYYITINTDVNFSWYVDGSVYVETGSGNGGGGGYGGTMLTTDWTARLEIWMTANSGGSGYVYASW